MSDGPFECMIYSAHLPSMTASFRIPAGLPFASGMYEMKRVRTPTDEDEARWAHLPEPPDDGDLEDTISELRTELNAALGHMLNAAIDLETGTKKATTLATLNGGIKRLRAAIAKASEATTHDD